MWKQIGEKVKQNDRKKVRAEIVYGESYCVPWSSYKEREQNKKKVPKNQMGMFGCCGGGGASDQEKVNKTNILNVY